MTDDKLGSIAQWPTNKLGEKFIASCGLIKLTRELTDATNVMFRQHMVDNSMELSYL